MPGGRESAGRRPRRKQCPEGEKKHFKKWPGPQAQREQRPEGEKNYFKNGPGRRPKKNIVSWQQNPARRAKFMNDSP